MACGDNKALCLNPSELRHSITIQSVARVSDGAGGQTETWETSTTAWASISPANGHQKWQAMQSETPITHKIKMRYQSGISTSNRIVYDNRTFDIVEVLNVDERDIVLHIMAVENLVD